MFERERKAVAEATSVLTGRVRSILQKATQAIEVHLLRLPQEVEEAEERHEEIRRSIRRGARRTDGGVV